MGRKSRLWESLFLLFVLALPFQTPFQLPIGNTSIQLSDAILAAACIAWLSSASHQFRWTRFHTLLLFLLAAVSMSTAFSAAPSTSLIKLAGKLSLAAAAFLGFEFVRSRVDLERFARVWWIASAVVVLLCLLGIAGFYAGIRDPAINVVVHPIFGSLPAGNYPRIEGLFAYPSVLCNYLSVSLWLVVIVARTAKQRTAALVFVLCLAVTAAFTFTPGLGGMFLAAGVFVAAAGPLARPARIAVVAASILVAAAFLVVSSLTLFSYTADGWSVPLAAGEFTPSHRAMAWRSGFETFLEHPVVGKGVGLPTAQAIYIDPNGNRQLLADAHNTYINVLAETGVLGLTAFMAILLWTAGKVWKLGSMDRSTHMVRLCLGLALLDAVFYQSVTGSFEDQRHLWVFLGAVAGYCVWGERRTAPGKPEAAQSLVPLT